MSESATPPPAADMHWHEENPDAVARVLVRVDYADGRIREYEAADPDQFQMNNPEADLAFGSVRKRVQAAGSPLVPLVAAVPRLRLSFTASPRHGMLIRTEATASPREPREASPTPPPRAAQPPALAG